MASDLTHDQEIEQYQQAIAVLAVALVRNTLDPVMVCKTVCDDLEAEEMATRLAVEAVEEAN